MNKTFIFLLAAMQMQSAGLMLQAQDANTTGRDDIFGKLLSTGGKALGSYANGDVKSVDSSLKLIADSIYDFLGETRQS